MSPLDGLRDAIIKASVGQRRAWAREVVQLLTDPDLTIRTRAIAALDMLPANPKTVLNIVQAHPDLFRETGQGYPLFPANLEDAIWYWASDKPEVAMAVRDRLPIQPDLVVFLAEYDHEWVLENASKLVHRNVLGGVLLSFPPHKRAELLQALGPWDDARDVLRESWWRRLEDASALRKIIAPE